MTNIVIYEAKKIDKKTKEVLKEYKGTAEDISKKINVSYKSIANASSSGYRTNGYYVKRIGIFVEKYDLYENGKLIDCNTLEEIAKKHYFMLNTVYQALQKRNGRCYQDYVIKHTGVYKFIED